MIESFSKLLHLPVLASKNGQPVDELIIYIHWLMIVLFIATSSFRVSQVDAGDWPQILGPNRNGLAVDEVLADKWPDGNPKKLWEATVGSGFAGQGFVDQVTGHTPGMEISVVANRTLDGAAQAYRQIGIDDVAVVSTAAELDAAMAAHRPAIVAGSGVHLAAARDEISRLANTWGIPVATSIHGKGALAEDNPWSLGVAGANGARDYANDYLAAADATSQGRAVLEQVLRKDQVLLRLSEGLHI